VSTKPGLPAGGNVENQTLLAGEYGGERFKPDNSWRDLPFLIAFLLHILGVIALISYSSTVPLDCPSNNGTYGFLGVPCNVGQGDTTDILPIVYFVGICAAISIVFAAVYINLLRKFTNVMVYLGIGCTIATNIGFAVYCGLVLQSIGGAVFFGIMAAFLALYFFLIRSRIAFAIEMLSVSASVITAYPATQAISYLSIFVKLCFFSFWTATVVYAQRLPSNGSSAGAFVFLIFSFYWTFEVIKNVVHVSVSGTVATWYFMANNMPENPTLGAFKRAVTQSLGSIAFGSLIVALIKTLRALFRIMLHKNSRNIAAVIMAYIALCFLACLDRLAQYFNHYAFCQVAIYGKTYIEAARSTWNLIKHAGFEAILNDNLIDGVLWMGILFGSLATALFAVLLANMFTLFNAIATVGWIMPFIIGFAIGFVLLVLAMQTIDSAVATVFVCFAEDKETLRLTQPALYNSLMSTYYNVDL